MTSPLKIAANRRNAKRSTGPKSAGGRLRSSQNARRHGLSLPIFADETLSEEARVLAIQLFADLNQPELRPYVERVAETQVDLNRIRRLKQRTIETVEVCESKSRASVFEQSSSLAAVIRELHQLERYERRAWSRRKTAFRELQLMIKKG